MCAVGVVVRDVFVCIFMGVCVSIYIYIYMRRVVHALICGFFLVRVLFFPLVCVVTRQELILPVSVKKLLRSAPSFASVSLEGLLHFMFDATHSKQLAEILEWTFANRLPMKLVRSCFHMCVCVCVCVCV